MKPRSEERYKHTRVGSMHLISIEWVADIDILSHPTCSCYNTCALDEVYLHESEATNE